MKKRYLIPAFMLLFGGLFLWYESNKIETSTFVYKNRKLPENFDGFSIVQISDLHNKRFSSGQRRLIKKIESLSPDIIVVTGDIIKRTSIEMDNALEFLEKAVDIAPVYFTPGNHEIHYVPRRTLYKKMRELGVTILINEREILDVYGQQINLWGLDPMNEYIKCLKEIYKEKDDFNILLAHRPDRFRIYAKSKADLILAGHAHGGGIRINGKPLYAPNQGFHPPYACDAHVLGKSTMIVSRGLGDAVIPIRIFNRPEIVEIILKKDYSFE
ncbi:MAG: metallophosphoesterase [Firmicutes bacterium]|nr:metallophosphoesterase [Bacillota bacterium]